MDQIAGFIECVIRDFDASRERVTEEVIALCEKFPIYN
jgi:glycine/serine hydroxymethyltransferase